MLPSVRSVQPFDPSAAIRCTMRYFATFLSLIALQVIVVTSADAFQSGGSSPNSLLQQARDYNQGRNGRFDAHSAAVLFQQAMDQGSYEAMAWLGNLYVQGRGVPRDINKGINLITSSANQGEPVGLRFAGVLYEKGLAVEQDLSKAKAFYEQAAAKGDGAANGRLGMMYLWGRGVPRDLNKGRNLLGQGASAGDVWSEVELGRVYESSLKQTDRPLAIPLYTAAATAGSRVASYRLGRIYEFGLVGQKQDIQKAVDFYRRSARQGDPSAQLTLGRLYMVGKGVPRDDVRAYTLFILAATKGENRAEIYERKLAQRMNAQQVAQASAIAQKVMAARTLYETQGASDSER